MPEPEIPQSSWADEIEEGDAELPPPSEKVQGDNKIVTAYQFNEDGKKVRVVRTYKIEKKLVSKSVARRKALPKFGMSAGDRPGPNPATTVVAEDVAMQFVANKDEHEKDDGDKSALDKLKEGGNKGVVKCRICKEDHWTTNCPYKDTLGPLRDSLAGKTDEDKIGEEGGAAGGPGGPGGPPGGAAGGGGGGGVQGGKYVPPSRRGGDGAVQRLGESMPDRRRSKKCELIFNFHALTNFRFSFFRAAEDTAAIRVSNLSENTQETDLQELFKPFGHIARIFLAKDKMTGQCKGFAFINYYKKDDAAKAIATLNGFGYDHLILNVEWAKPSGS